MTTLTLCWPCGASQIIYFLLFSVYGTGNFDPKSPAAQPRVLILACTRRRAHFGTSTPAQLQVRACVPLSLSLSIKMEKKQH
jgi:hypothetical protein